MQSPPPLTNLPAPHPAGYHPPSWRQTFHTLFILLTPPRFPALTLTLLANDVSSYFTAGGSHLGTLSPSHSQATTLPSALGTCAPCLSFCFPSWYPHTSQRRTPPLTKDFRLLHINSPSVSSVTHQTSHISHLKAKPTKTSPDSLIYLPFIASCLFNFYNQISPTNCLVLFP